MSHHVRVASPADFLAVAALDRVAWGDATFIVDGEHVWRVWCEHATVLIVPEPGDGAEPGGVKTAANRAEAQAGAVAAALVMFATEDGGLFLHKIMVASRWRGRGMGTALMQAALARATVPVRLTVDPDNQAALELYQRYGFRVERHVEGYYRPHEHRYVMIYEPKDTRPTCEP